MNNKYKKDSFSFSKQFQTFNKQMINKKYKNTNIKANILIQDDIRDT